MRRLVLAVFAMSIMLIMATATFGTEQTLCPVMTGNPIKKDISLSYQGKLVYFCCSSCKAEFLKDPQKYLPNLPQFSHSSTDDRDIIVPHEHENGHFSTASLIVPLGISTFTLLLITLAAGLFMKKNRKLLFPWHRRLAVATLFLAIAHVVCIFLAD